MVKVETYTIKDIEHDTTFTMSLKAIIKEINRGRNENWIDYDETDWREGLQEFTSWEIIDDRS